MGSRAEKESRWSKALRSAASRDVILKYLRKHLPLSEDESVAGRLESSTGVLDSVPMQCRGPECPLAARCPVSQRPEFLDTPCVLQTIEAYRHFRDYVISLEIDPRDYTDLQMVVDLVRTHVLSWWIDQLLAMEGIMQTNTTVSGKSVSKTRVSHPLIAEQRALIRERNLIYKELMASRRARLEREAMEKRGALDLARMMAQVAKQAKEAASRLTVSPVISEPIPALPSDSDELVSLPYPLSELEDDEGGSFSEQ